MYELSVPQKIQKSKCTKKTPHFLFQNLKMLRSKELQK